MTQSSSSRISACVGSDSRSPSSWEKSHGLPSEPRARATAAAPVRSNASRTSSGVRKPPEMTTGTGSSSTRLRASS